MHWNKDDQGVFLVCAAILLVMLIFRRRGGSSGTACGTAAWMSEAMFRAAGMLADKGLILGRTFSGELLRLPHYCHILLVGATGSGKGVSIIIPNLLTYFRGSIVCFDTKGDLFETTAGRRAAMGQRIIRIAPFNGGRDALNPLDTIPRDSPMLVDHARAMAESLVVRQGTEHDPHWNDKAAQVICALLVLVLLRFEGEERSLNTVQEIASELALLEGAAERLREMGGIPARLGNQLKGLFDDGKE